MATTQKRAKKKVAKKVAKKKAAKKVAKKEVLDFLESSDLATIEKLSKEVELSKLSMALEEQSQRNMELEYLLQQQKISKQREVVLQKAEAYEKRKQSYRDFIKDIGLKYGLKEGQRLGYNPETGEIVKD